MTRLRQMRQAAIEAELPDAAWRLTDKDYQLATEFSYFEAQESLRVTIRKAVQGYADMREALDHLTLEARRRAS